MKYLIKFEFDDNPVGVETEITMTKPILFDEAWYNHGKMLDLFEVEKRGELLLNIDKAIQGENRISITNLDSETRAETIWHYETDVPSLILGEVLYNVYDHEIGLLRKHPDVFYYEAWYCIGVVFKIENNNFVCPLSNCVINKQIRKHFKDRNYDVTIDKGKKRIVEKRCFNGKTAFNEVLDICLRKKQVSFYENVWKQAA